MRTSASSPCVPSPADQMRLIAEIDEAIAKYSDIVKTYQDMRTALLVHWSVNGDAAQFRSIMSAERVGAGWYQWAAQTAWRYFKRLKERLTWDTPTEHQER